jgi:hypothetical protein
MKLSLIEVLIAKIVHNKEGYKQNECTTPDPPTVSSFKRKYLLNNNSMIDEYQFHRRPYLSPSQCDSWVLLCYRNPVSFMTMECKEEERRKKYKSSKKSEHRKFKKQKTDGHRRGLKGCRKVRLCDSEKRAGFCCAEQTP